MSYRFSGSGPFVGVRVRIVGPTGTYTYMFALDTGATWTVVSPRALAALGYDVDTASHLSEVITASGREALRRIDVDSISALGVSRVGLRVVCHQLPSGLRVEGLLGLDFLRGRRLEVDFAAGSIDLR